MTGSDAPFALLNAWLTAADGLELNDPNAMTLATVGGSGRPSARMVLLKGIDTSDDSGRGFVFYTNTESRKGDELLGCGFVALLFHWKSLRRQIRVEGAAAPVSDAEADAYYATRPRLSRLGAWASDQSRPLPDRATLERRLAENEARFSDGAIPRPPYWGGFRVVPEMFEFWQDMPYRLHDRTVYRRAPDGWTTSKLYP